MIRRGTGGFSALEKHEQPGALELVPPASAYDCGGDGGARDDDDDDDDDDDGSEEESGQEQVQEWDGVPESARSLRSMIPCLLVLGAGCIAGIIGFGAWFIHAAMHSGDKRAAG
jgi:hypothetical protein